MARVHVWLRFLRRLFKNLPKRAWLTLRYHGVRETLWRLVSFPLRLTPLGPRLGLVARMDDPSAPARAWHTAHGRPVAIVIASYGPAKLALKAARAVKRTTRGMAVRVIVADDGSPAAEVERLRGSRHVDVVVPGANAGFAANCNRGIAAARADEDVVLLNSDTLAHRGWLEVLQHAAYEAGGERVGVVGAKLLYGDDTIQHAGVYRNLDAPEWFDHRFRFQVPDHPSADVLQPALAVTGACLYVTRDTLDAVGTLDEAYGMAYEDVDFCLRVWESGRRVLYAPAATVTHLESKTRGMVQGERELHAQRTFWERWGAWFDARETRDEDGGVRVVYVTQDVGVGGGHRVVFEHLEGLLDRGHHPELWTLADGPPDWYDLRVPVRSFPDYPALTRALAPLDCVKVATWWETAPAVWEASVTRGVPVYFVQDVEVTYYDDPDVHGQVLTTYRPEFEFLTTSGWVFHELVAYAMTATVISPGVDVHKWRELPEVERADDAVVALGRGNPLKNFPLTRDAYAALADPKPRLDLFGIEPQVADGMGDRVTYHLKPSDAEVNELLNGATAFLQTSRHEGFCLPVLEAMAAGAPVVCTNAHGNADFCEDGVNCLLVDATPGAVSAAVERVLREPDLRARLRDGGHATAEAYALQRKNDEIDGFYRALAQRRASGERPAPVAAPTKAELAAIATRLGEDPASYLRRVRDSRRRRARSG